MPYKDLFGQALVDFYQNKAAEDIITWTNISEKDALPLAYLFREYNEMPLLERYALKKCFGNILDVGCGTGSHSLYLQEQGLHVTAIDISEGAITVAKNRGVYNARVQALLEVTEKFDTILLLMNGTGIFEELTQVPNYLQHLKSILAPNGQILIDSSDIKYMFEDEEDDTIWRSPNMPYYGELNYYISYKGKEEHPMKWLYLDFNTLQKACAKEGLHCIKLKDGAHFDFLVKISNPATNNR